MQKLTSVASSLPVSGPMQDGQHLLHENGRLKDQLLQLGKLNKGGEGLIIKVGTRGIKFNKGGDYTRR